MFVRFLNWTLIALMLPAAIVLAGSRPVAAQSPAPSPQSSDEGDAEHLLRGPIHEAFAEPVNFNPQPGIVVPKAPPEPVPEAGLLDPIEQRMRVVMDRNR